MQHELRVLIYAMVFVVAVCMCIVSIGVAMCVWAVDDIVRGTFKCDQNNKLFELVALTMSSLLNVILLFVKSKLP